MQIIQDLLLDRGNDLTEFFWPLFYYIKDAIFVHRQIPLWNNLFFAGTPLAPDPQNPTWYLPNAIFLLTDINTGIIVSLLAHQIFAGVGFYYAARRVFEFTKKTSLFMAVLYSLSPIYFSYLEAGHWGLLICWAWLPYLLISTHKSATKPNFKWAILFLLAAVSLYVNHILTAILALGTAGIYILWKKAFKWGLVLGVMFALLIGPLFLIQYNWQKETTRNLLLDFPEIFPIWRGKAEFLKTFFVFNPETEKAITFGVIPALAAVVGVLNVRGKKSRLVLLLILLTITLVVLNNVSPISPVLSRIAIFKLMRVTTRVWLLAYFVLLYLFGLGIEKMNKNLANIIIVASIIEYLLIGASYLAKPAIAKQNVPVSFFEVLENDKDVYKIFCTTRCISQKDAAIYGLHLADGYGTLPQTNYFFAAEQIGQYYWQRYSLSIPPQSLYLYKKIIPYAPALSAYAVKYVIAPYQLQTDGLSLIKRENDFFMYQNTLFKPVNYLLYSPNHIAVSVSEAKDTLSIPEIYSPGWVAFDDKGTALTITENHDFTLDVALAKNSKTVDLYFRPFSKMLNPF